MDTKLLAEALAGPWRPVLADRHGRVYDSVADALEGVGHADEDVTVAVVRGSAMPELRGNELHLPGMYNDGDIAFRRDDVYLEDPDDWTVGAEARYEQAKAMAAGLNAATS